MPSSPVSQISRQIFGNLNVWGDAKLTSCTDLNTYLKKIAGIRGSQGIWEVRGDAKLTSATNPEKNLEKFGDLGN